MNKILKVVFSEDIVSFCLNIVGTGMSKKC